MELYLLRHAIAEEREAWRSGPDSERPLTREGRGKTRRIAAGMRALDLRFELILSSPYVRARQTAELVARAFRCRRLLVFSDHLVPAGNARLLMKELAGRKPRVESVLLVGHEPDLGRLASMLLSGHPGLDLPFKKGGLCKLTIETVRYARCARLDWMLTPRQLAALA